MGSAGGLGGGWNGGGCFDEFRRMYPEATDKEIRQCEITCTLDNELGNLSYTFRYEVHALTELDKDYWFHLIPYESSNVSHLWARNGNGSLQTEIQSQENKTLAIIKYRTRPQSGSTFDLEFGFNVPFHLKKVLSVFNTTLMYSDWFTHTERVQRLSLRLKLPHSNLKVLSSSPPCSDTQGNELVWVREDQFPREVFMPNAMIRVAEPLPGILATGALVLSSAVLSSLLSYLSGVLSPIIPAALAAL